MNRSSGFTLIEVLVALAVVAITLATGLQAMGALTRATERQSQQWLAQLCAENELTRLRLARQLPSVGDSSNTCEQAGRTLSVRLSVQATPNPNFRRIDARVQAQVDGQELVLLTLSTVQGRY
ncbi:type II secretion system minor pseudopilin GspI [Hydrogenophaga sp.]|uniref:type II secretion system minor pseudopilin GspI n=1 Tax=Hydrogenophaga sp. TaxID=1904254 RepID=UPI0019A79886|nr:type II secretion system minor pseudopilin GspI [Hydrogenophaga sp.]MBD3892622.1 type II secretion system protein GspI [Hydrogenophaga sp.]